MEEDELVRVIRCGGRERRIFRKMCYYGVLGRKLWLIVFKLVVKKLSSIIFDKKFKYLVILVFSESFCKGLSGEINRRCSGCRRCYVYIFLLVIFIF